MSQFKNKTIKRLSIHFYIIALTISRYSCRKTIVGYMPQSY